MASAVVGALRVMLSANTAEYVTAMDRAELKTQNTTKAMQRMVQSFDGSKITGQADKIATAIGQIDGGISKLTKGEINRIAPTIQAAMDKFRALGVEAPPHIAKLSNEITALNARAATTTGGLGGLGAAAKALGPFLPIATIGGAALALIRLGSNAFESASQITDLANKTKLSGEFIQRLQNVANQTGTELEKFTQASFKLGINVAEGGKKARDAFADLGVSFDAVRQAAPDERLRMVIKALEGVQGAERDRIGSAIFGMKEWSAMAASVEEGFTRLADSARVMSDAQREALDDAGDAWQQFKDNAAKQIAGHLGNVVQLIAGVKKELGALSLTELLASAVAGSQAGISPVQFLKALADASVETKKRTTDVALSLAGASSATRDYVGEVAHLTDKLKALDSVTRMELDAAIKLGASAEELEERFGLTATEVKLYGDVVSEASRRSKELEESKKKLSAETKKFWEEVQKLNAQLIPLTSWMKIETDVELDNVTLKSRNFAATAKLNKELEEYARQTGAVTMSTAEMSGSLDGATEKAESLDDQLSELSGALSELAQVSGESFGGMLQGLASIVTSLNTANKAVASMTTGWSKLSGENKDVKGGLLDISTGAIGAGVALGQATKQGSTLSRTVGGMAAGAKIGSMFGPWGTAIGAAAGALVGLVRGLSSVSAEVKKSREEVEAFQVGLAKTLTTTQLQEAGGERWKMTVIGVRDAYLAVGRTAAEAEQDVLALWDTDHPDRARAAMEKINNVLKQQAEQLAKNKASAASLYDEIMSFAGEQGGIPASMRAMLDQFIALGFLTDEQAAKLRGLGDSGAMDIRKMEEALGLFNGRVISLGPAFQQAKINETAMKYANALDFMIKNGADVGGALFDAREELSQLVLDSRQFKTTIPANLRGFIEHLAETGNLLDENGEKITDLSGVKWGPAMKSEAEIAAEGWSKILAKLEELIAKITGPLEKAFDGIPKDLPDPFRDWRTPRLPGMDDPIVIPEGSASFAQRFAPINPRDFEPAVSAGLAVAARSGESTRASAGSTTGGDIVIVTIRQQPGENDQNLVERIVRVIPRFAGNERGIKVKLRQALDIT